MNKWKKLKQLVRQKAEGLEPLNNMSTKFEVSYKVFKMVLDKMNELEQIENKPCDECTHLEDQDGTYAVCLNRNNWKEM